MTQKKKYYFCFALAISICMTVLIQVFQLYSLPILGILELFMLVNVCMIAVNIFIFVFFFYLVHHRGLPRSMRKTWYYVCCWMSRCRSSKAVRLP